MKITKIELQKNDNERVNVYIDDEFAFGLSAELVYKYSLEKNMRVEKDFLEEILFLEDKIVAKNQALNFLSYRMRSEREVIDKLKESNYSEEIIHYIIDFLYEYKLLDDYEFGLAYLNDKVNLNNYGPLRIKNDLYKKGLSSKNIDNIMSNYKDEYEKCLLAFEKRIDRYENDSRLYGRIFNYLRGRGFNSSTIVEVLKDNNIKRF